MAKHFVQENRDRTGGVDDVVRWLLVVGQKVPSGIGGWNL